MAGHEFKNSKVNFVFEYTNDLLLENKFICKTEIDPGRYRNLFYSGSFTISYQYQGICVDVEFKRRTTYLTITIKNKTESHLNYPTKVNLDSDLQTVNDTYEFVNKQRLDHSLNVLINECKSMIDYSNTNIASVNPDVDNDGHHPDYYSSIYSSSRLMHSNVNRPISQTTMNISAPLTMPNEPLNVPNFDPSGPESTATAPNAAFQHVSHTQQQQQQSLINDPPFSSLSNYFKAPPPPSTGNDDRHQQ